MARDINIKIAVNKSNRQINSYFKRRSLPKELKDGIDAGKKLSKLKVEIKDWRFEEWIKQ